MTLARILARILATTLGAFAVFACAQAAPAESAKTTETYQKPGIPLSLTHGKAATVAPGETAQAIVTLSSIDDATVQLTLASKTGLTILGPTNRTLTLDAGIPETLTIDVRATQSGRHYLDVVASLDGATGTRAISVPVQIGEGGVIGKATPGTLGTDADGKPVVAMPAAETINGVVVRDPASEQLEPR